MRPMLATNINYIRSYSLFAKCHDIANYAEWHARYRNCKEDVVDDDVNVHELSTLMHISSAFKVHLIATIAVVVFTCSKRTIFSPSPNRSKNDPNRSKATEGDYVKTVCTSSTRSPFVAECNSPDNCEKCHDTIHVATHLEPEDEQLSLVNWVSQTCTCCLNFFLSIYCTNPALIFIGIIEAKPGKEKD